VSYGQLACYCTFGFTHQLEISVLNLMDIPWKWISLVMSLLAMIASAIAIQDVRTQQTSKGSKWYQATVGILITSIIAIVWILFAFYNDQQKALGNSNSGRTRNGRENYY